MERTQYSLYLRWPLEAALVNPFDGIPRKKCYENIVNYHRYHSHHDSRPF
jgi:hypothetical protein